MSTDVTSLVLEVDSRQADKATDSLERLTKAGKTLESQLDKEVTAHDRVARAAEKAVRARDNKGRFIGQQREYNRTLEDEVAKTARSNWLMEQKTAIAKRLGMALGIAASAAAGLVTYAIIRNTIEAEEGMAQLEARLRSTAGAAGISKDALVQLADNLQAVTRFEDDAIIAAEGLLLTFTKVGRDVFPQAMESALNLSTVMKQDLQSSIMQVGKAHGMVSLNDALMDLVNKKLVAPDEAYSKAVDKPGFEGLLLSQVATDGRPLFIPDATTSGRVGSIFGRPVYSTNAALVKSTTVGDDTAVAGDFANSAIYGTVEGVQIDVSDQATVNDGGTQVNLWQRNMFAVRAEIEVGFITRNVNHFVRITDGVVDTP